MRVCRNTTTRPTSHRPKLAHVYRVGAIAAIVALAGTLIDIVLTMLPSWEVSTVPVGMEQWFVQFQRNPLLGLRNLDLLNVIIAVVSIPLYVALYGAHRRVSQGYAALALVVFVIGTALFIANNAALPMLELSQQFVTAGAQAEPLAYYAAGTALLASAARTDDRVERAGRQQAPAPRHCSGGLKRLRTGRGEICLETRAALVKRSSNCCTKFPVPRAW